MTHIHEDCLTYFLSNSNNLNFDNIYLYYYNINEIKVLYILSILTFRMCIFTEMTYSYGNVGF